MQTIHQINEIVHQSYERLHHFDVLGFLLIHFGESAGF